jgi:hypothetical protein
VATETNLDFTLGEDWEIDFDLNDADGVNLDLTGATVAFRLARRGRTILTLESPGSDVGVDSPATLGTGLITVTPTDQSSAVPAVIAAVHEYEVRVTLADGRKTTQAFGSLNVARSLF